MFNDKKFSVGFEHFFKHLTRRYLSAAFVITLILIGVYKGAIPVKDAYTIYSQPGTSEKKALFFLKDISKVSLPQGSSWERRKDVIAQSYAAAGDFNNDGYEDLVYLYNGRRANVPPIFRVLRNTTKRSYEDITAHIGLKEVTTWKDIYAVAFIDVDNDGWEDLLIARRVNMPALFMNKKGNFIHNKNAFVPNYTTGDIKQISIFDYNLDGALDIHFSHYGGPASGYYKNADLFAWSPSNADDGGDNHILHNNGDGTFISIPGALGANDSGYTWATAISDFNNDGYPDIFNANDFGFDKLYLGKGGKSFVETTDGMGSYRSHNSMSAEVGDFDNDGKFDIFASNNTKAGMTEGFNSLWKNIGMQNNIFTLKNIAADQGVSSCGWSWGAKFADLDKDGWLDLLVVNGRHNAPNPSNWFLVHSSFLIPYWAKRAGLTGLEHTLNASLAGQQRNCLFWNQKGTSFNDVALDVGVADLENGRSVVATDIDNDGNEDFFITNLGAGPILYATARQNSNSWLGVKLVGSKSNKFGIGAKIKLVSGDGVTSQMREVFPTNGFFSQSSRRQLFGISESDAKLPQKLIVYWPSGNISEIKNPDLNTYITVREAK